MPVVVAPRVVLELTDERPPYGLTITQEVLVRIHRRLGIAAEAVDHHRPGPRVPFRGVEVEVAAFEADPPGGERGEVRQRRGIGFGDDRGAREGDGRRGLGRGRRRAGWRHRPAIHDRDVHLGGRIARRDRQQVDPLGIDLDPDRVRVALGLPAETSSVVVAAGERARPPHVDAPDRPAEEGIVRVAAERVGRCERALVGQPDGGVRAEAHVLAGDGVAVAVDHREMREGGQARPTVQAIIGEGPKDQARVRIDLLGRDRRVVVRTVHDQLEVLAHRCDVGARIDEHEVALVPLGREFRGGNQQPDGWGRRDSCLRREQRRDHDERDAEDQRDERAMMTPWGHRSLLRPGWSIVCRSDVFGTPLVPARIHAPAAARSNTRS